MKPVISKNNPVESFCHGKQGFDSRVLADRVANRKTRRGADVLRPYRCGSCRKWHLGHQKRKTARETPNKLKTGGARRMPKDSGND